MISRDGPHSELLALCGEVRDGNLSTEQFRRLEAMLQGSAESRQIYVRFMQLDAYFSRQDRVALQGMADENRPRLPADADNGKSSNELDGVGGAASRLDGWLHPEVSGEPLKRQSPADPTGRAFAGFRATVPGTVQYGTHGLGTLEAPRRLFVRPLPLAICASLVTAIIVLSMERLLVSGPSRPSNVVSNPGGESRESRRYVATLVSANNCRWDRARSTASLERGDTLRAGQALHLMEGVAEINSVLPGGGVTELQLEGPLAMMLTSEGMPNLLYGKLTGKFTCEYDRFTLDTPLGRVVVSGDASIGVTAAANDVELHVFSGQATLEVWSIGLGNAIEQLTAAAGSSLRARVGGDGAISVDRGSSRENRFITPAAVAASRLSISDEYVSTIRGAKPVAYWRFEDEVEGLLRNEVGDRFHLRIVGDAVRLHSGHRKGENRWAEFGIATGPGYLEADDLLDGVIRDDYTVEGWIKPTYYHHGAFFSLIEWSPPQSPFQRHRLQLELCGPVSGFHQPVRPTEFHPGRIRFMHQNSQCFSSSPYLTRKWQHIAAVKDKANLKLYADGELVGAATDSRTLGSGLRILMGQLYPQSPHLLDEVTSRLYIGELDEMALYDRPLSQEAIASHVRLARPDAGNPPQGQPQDR